MPNIYNPDNDENDFTMEDLEVDEDAGEELDEDEEDEDDTPLFYNDEEE